MAGEVDVAYQQGLTDLRAIRGRTVEHSVALASAHAGQEDQAGDQANEPSADEWGDVERDAVVHLVHTVSILGVCSDGCTVTGAPAHATLSVGEQELDVVAIRGETHPSCRRHYTRTLPPGRRPVILVSRDVDNIRLVDRFGSYLEPTPTEVHVAERDFTNPQYVARQIGYQDLLRIVLDSATIDEAKEQFNAKLGH